MEDHPGIIFRDGPTGRRAALSGGPDVWEVIAAIHASGHEGEEALAATAEWGSLSLAQARAAVRYYTEYPQEIDERITRNIEEADADEQRWRREQRAMAPSTKQSVAFRFNRATVRHLKQRAQELHAPQTALAERYIEEGLRQDEHPLVHFRDGEMGRRPALLGTRLDVAEVKSTLRQNANSIEDTAEYLEITLEQVEACLRYYADYQDEIDAWIERSLAVARRERERWQHRQRALA